MSKKPKRPRKAKMYKKRRVKKVLLKRNETLHVAVPKTEVPVVVHHDQAVVVIAPAPKQTWMQFLFGTINT